MSGRRIVDIKYLIDQVQTRHVGGFDCSFVDMDYQSESIYGFQTIITFKFRVCNIKKTLYSERCNETMIPINKAVVNACQTIGILVLNNVNSRHERIVNTILLLLYKTRNRTFSNVRTSSVVRNAIIIM